MFIMYIHGHRIKRNSGKCNPHAYFKNILKTASVYAPPKALHPYRDGQRTVKF